MNITDSEFILMRRNNRLAAQAQSVVNQAVANEATLRREIASLREQIAAEQGRRRHAEFRLARATN
ncbi:MAG TPA: hypothetical protein VL017_08670 [Devosia sp.]|nr:hypothetical protein [Devosia sp.]